MLILSENEIKWRETKANRIIVSYTHKERFFLTLSTFSLIC